MQTPNEIEAAEFQQAWNQFFASDDIKPNEIEDAEFQQAWNQHCAIDDIQSKIREISAFKAVTIAEIQYRDGRLKELTDELAELQLAPAQTPATPEPVEPASEKPTATIDRGWVMKKAALIKKHEPEWPTINRDFQDASDNGLSIAAKAPGHGEWFEADALNWARQRGKLNETTGQQAPSRATPFSGLTHRIKG